MYERFTDRARAVFRFADQEARRFKHEYVGDEHVLLGLIKEGSGVAAHVLRSFNIDFRRARGEVERLVGTGSDEVLMRKLPQTSRAKKLVEFACEEARSLKDNFVGTEHLLLGLLHNREGVAVNMLISCDVKTDDIRAEVLKLLNKDETIAVSIAPSGFNDRDMLIGDVRNVIEQLEAIQEGIAEIAIRSSELDCAHPATRLWSPLEVARGHLSEACKSLDKAIRIV